MSELPPCPHCGLKTGVYTNVRAYGWCQEYFDECGIQVEMGTDDLLFSTSQTVRCDNCMKIRRDLMVVNLGKASANIVARKEIE